MSSKAIQAKMKRMGAIICLAPDGQLHVNIPDGVKVNRVGADMTFTYEPAADQGSVDSKDGGGPWVQSGNGLMPGPPLDRVGQPTA